MKKLTDSEATKILSERPARRFIQSVEDGKVRLTFDSDIFVTTKGEEDILGYVWDRDWDKVEARVLINGMPKIYSLGNKEYSFVADFIETCNTNNIPLDSLEGHVFDITKTAQWTQEIDYVGKSDGASVSKEIKVNENLLKDAMEAINDLKTNSPELVSNCSINDLVTAISVRGRMKASQAKDLIPELEKKGIIKITGDKTSVI